MVLEKKPDNEDFVFTHGDYCMANIILLGNKLSGFIDLGRAGVSDRYQDIALAVRSFEHNFGTDKWNDLFYKEYGIEDVDYSKIEFYILLDELF
ncbi:Aminoglycoside phosphotransferase [Maledivibacter halophilus]|uniref:Aminoglycoside phosphotransferase n=1 Tax=Maledivibacter halophilus TaxID=36842 RepID=A0A1T5M0Z6_9FIRM|nr:Aminoglycoside phosphotransferase [Maledivibacter halophilus]